MEATTRKQNFMGDDANNKLMLLTDVKNPQIQITFAGADAVRLPVDIDTSEFIAVRSAKAKGKRLSAYPVADVVLTSYDEDESLEDEEIAEPVQDEVPDAQSADETDSGSVQKAEPLQGELDLF